MAETIPCVPRRKGMRRVITLRQAFVFAASWIGTPFNQPLEN
jgi:hypothetical protein